MNNFELVSNCIIESHGEFPEIDKAMLIDDRITKRFLFWTRKIVRKYDLNSAKFQKKESDFCKKMFKNLNVLIYAIPDKHINCSTIPGYFGDMSKSGLLKPIIKTSLHKDYRALKNMKFESAKRGSNGVIIFPPNKLKTISIFPTYGLLALASPKERFAIYLHEIGHWNYLSKMIPRQILMNDKEFSQHVKTPDGLIPFYNIQLLNSAMKKGYARWNEYESDLYAARLGYGEYLKSFFDKSEIGFPKDLVDAYTYLQSQKTKKFYEYWNSLKSRIASGSGHPSHKHRKDQIDYAKKNKSYFKS